MWLRDQYGRFLNLNQVRQIRLLHGCAPGSWEIIAVYEGDERAVIWWFDEEDRAKLHMDRLAEKVGVVDV